MAWLVSRNSVVLVSPLDWGLGHATRLSPLVATLRARGCEVILAGSGRSLGLLSADYPDLRVVRLPSFSPRLSGGDSQWWVIALQVPWFLFCIVRERIMVERIVRRHGVGLIVSDNRYGVRSRLCRSVFLTHQFNPRASSGAPRWFGRLLSRTLAFFESRFDACLVPDIAIGSDSSLSGSLSWPVPRGVRAHCVGALSRLPSAEVSVREESVDWLGIVSGPEPHRGMFERALIRRFSSLPGRRVVVCGRADGCECQDVSGVFIVPLASASRLKSLLLAAERIVCRSGYSTLLDLSALALLGRKPITLVPTPGQAEQEYLAERMAAMFENCDVADAKKWL